MTSRLKTCKVISGSSEAYANKMKANLFQNCLQAESQLKILVIDDDTDITQMLADYFVGNGESCTVYNNAVEGLKAVRDDYEFDVLLLDLAMPEFSGFDALKALTYQELLVKKHVIIITAMDISPKRERQMLEAGVVAIVRKPFSLNTLQEFLERYR